MVKRYTIAEARANLAAVVDEAETEAVELTRRGKPVVVVVSLAEYERLTRNRSSFSEAFRAFVDNFDNAAHGVDPEYWRSQRDDEPGRDFEFE